MDSGFEDGVAIGDSGLEDGRDVWCLGEGYFGWEDLLRHEGGDGKEYVVR